MTLHASWSARAGAALLALYVLAAAPAGARVAPSHPDLPAVAVAEGRRGPSRPALHGPTDVRNLNTALTYATIADALADPATLDGHVLEVQVASHSEGLVTVAKSVTIQGMAGGSEVRATTSTGSSGDARGWFLVTAPDVTFRDLTLDGESGSGVVIYQAIRFRAHGGRVEDCGFRNVRGGAGSYDGRGVAMFDANATVENCTFTNIARIGVHIFGAAVTSAVVRGCTYTGKGDGDWLDYGIEIGGGATATLTGNTITACTGVALSDGSTSAGVLATDYFAPGTQGTLEENVLSANTQGLAAGYVDGSHPVDATVVAATGNDLSGNAAGGVGSLVSGTLDASANWWGSNLVADVAAEVSGNPVDWTPWLDTGADTDGAPGFQGDFSTLHVDDDSPQSGSVGRVQEGVDRVTASTVLVGPGTYVEQVEIDQDLTLRGAGAASTTIVSPASLPLFFTTPGPNNNYPVIFVHDAADVRIELLAVDGDGQGNANYRFQGIAYVNAGGRVSQVEVRRIEETPFSGTQHGVAIYAFNTTGGPYALEIEYVELTDFQKNGMALNGAGLTVDVHDCVVRGKGYTAVTAQNGIQLSLGAAGTIRSCLISDMGYTPATFVASGVLVFATGGPVLVQDLRGGNLIANVQAPISWYDGDGTMDGIETAGGADYGPIFVYNSSAALAAGRRASSARPRPSAAALDADLGHALRAPSRTAASFAVRVLNSCLDGVDAAGTAGIGVYTEGGPLAVEARNNLIADWEVGLTTYGSAATLTARENSVTSHTAAGYDNTGSPTAQDAEDNWWGDPSGPSGDGGGSGDAVLGGNVDFTPWLASGANASPGCGFVPPVIVGLASDRNPSRCGDKVTFTATLSPAGATGSVEFFDAGSSLGSAPVVDGSATLSISTLSAGRHPVTARYGGDGDHDPASSAVLVQQVNCDADTTHTVVVTPCDSMGWFRANVRSGGTVEITGAFPHPTGSLEFHTTNSGSKADYVRPNGDADLLRTLTALAVDLYRSSSSTSPAHLAPAVRLFVDNGQAVDRFSYLIWEPVYNGIPVFPTDAWGTYDLAKHHFWQRAFKSTPPNRTIDLYSRTLSDWLQPGTVTDGDGDVSNVVGPDARVLAVEIGVGSGWSGTFDGAADRFRIGFATLDSLFDFEAGFPTHTALSSDHNPSKSQDLVVFTAVVSPATATGTVEFFDGATSIGTAPLSGGVATLSVKVTGEGIHAITAAYGGGSCHFASVSAELLQVVGGAPVLRIQDPTVVEGDAGTTNLVFTLFLSSRSTQTVAVDYATDDSTATVADNDYEPMTGTASFAPGDTVEVVVVPVYGDTQFEGTERMKLLLSNIVKAVLGDEVGVGTILNDDELPVGTLLALFRAEALPSGIELRWRFGHDARFVTVDLERSEGPDGPWIPSAAELRDEGGVTVALDRAVTAGRVYSYRLVARGSGGERSVFGPISAAAGGAPPAMALGRISPNPSRGPTRIEFTVARDAEVEVTVSDVQGRRLAVLAEGPHGPGTYVATWSGRGDRGVLPPGLYFVQMRAEGRTWTRRVALTP